MIDFENIYMQNFLSVGKEPIEFTFKKGLNIIIGENKDRQRSNGSGKSTSIEAIYFALFGKTIRGLNKSDVINKRFKKETIIRLNFSKDGDKYVIVRELKPSKLSLSKNGKDITRDSISNTQSDIESIIGVSEDVIKNCVIMGINQTIPFMAQTKVEKRKFIEGIFDMDIFSDMLKDVRKDYNEEMKNLTSLQSKNDEKTSNLTIYREQSDKFEQAKAEKVDKIKENIKQKQIEKKELQSKLIDLSDVSVDGYKELKNKFKKQIKDIITPKGDEYRGKIIEIKSEINTVKRKIDSLFTSGICPTCNRKMTEDDEMHVKDESTKLNDQKDKLAEELVEFTEKHQKVLEVNLKLTKDIEDCGKNIAEYDLKIHQNEIIENKIEDCDNSVKDMVENAKNIKGEVNNIDEVILKIEKESKLLTEDIENTIKNTEILDQIKFICGENGVKSYIVNKLLNIFNGKINYYLERLNANCVLKFDEFFEEKIINDKKQECSYFNFSSGERRNIDIAIMFAFMDLQKLQGKFDTNMLCFDELVDGSLDTDGVNYVVDILLEKCKTEGKSIYLITHRKELQQYATGDVIKIVKENGLSRMYK